MFGMLSAYKPELKIREYECYQAVYCGLCKQIAKSNGAFARLHLSYDLAFLALLGMEGKEPKWKLGRCLLNPLRKKRYYIDSPALEYAAHAGILLTYYQLKDTLVDERGFRKIAAWFALVPYSIMKRKSKKLFPDIAEEIHEKISGLFQAEKENNLTIDGYADFFASMLAKVFSGICPEGHVSRRILEEMGYLTGRWIYLMDAYQDMEEDAAKGRFNPLFICFKREETEIPAFRKQIHGRMEMAIQDTMARLSRAYELLEPGVFKPILDNIIYFSMERTYQSIAQKGASE